MTIKEFADIIGVSTTTVSRAMNGRGRLSSATRIMVLERMQELGFTPNVNAQRLSGGQTYLVAIDFGIRHDYLSDMFLVEITRGLQDLLETRGYGLLLSGPGEVFHRWVKTQAVDGVVLIGQSFTGGAPYDIVRAGTPCVVIGHHSLAECPGLGSVVVGLEHGARAAARFLLELGHRRIGIIGSTPEAGAISYLLDELQRHQTTLPDNYIRIAGPTPKGAEDAMLELMSLRERPTAVFARTDLHAAAALRIANRLGYRIPQDLSIVGHDDVPLAQLVNPPLTTVRVDCMDLAKAALDMLFGLLEDPGLSPKPQIVPTELVIRDTAAAPPYISSAGAFTALTTPAGINDSPGIIAGNLDE